jgi:hypothetical protein
MEGDGSISIIPFDPDKAEPKKKPKTGG